MNPQEYVAMDATALAAAVLSGEVTAMRLAELALEVAGEVDPTLGAIIETWDPELASSQTGPLAGVPMLLKDMGAAVRGRRMELGSRLTTGLVSDHTSALVDRFRAAGLVPLGRTTIPEFAAAVVTEPVATGATRNPFAPERTPGGSSGGSAAAVAAGIVPVAHATDAAGSIRVPAAHTALVGLKPSRGAVSWSPDPIPVDGLAVPFAVTRSVRDAKTLFDAVADHAVPARTGSMRIALTDGALGAESAASENVAAAAAVSQALRDAGHTILEVDVDLGTTWQQHARAVAQIWAYTTAQWIDALAAALQRDPAAHLEPQTRAIWQYGSSLSLTDLDGARETARAVSAGVERLFETVDVVVSPTTLRPAPLIGEFGLNAHLDSGEEYLFRSLNAAPLATPANVSGTPAISIPGAIADGVPLGVQLWAGRDQDRLLLRLAEQVEQRLPWREWRPVVRAGFGQ